MKEIIYYSKADGSIPFVRWYDKLKDQKLIARIDSRLDHLALGNSGDTESLGSGVHELKIHLGSGYRIYFANDGHEIIVLLVGGDKSSQKKDIAKAKNYWIEYKVNKQSLMEDMT